MVLTTQEKGFFTTMCYSKCYKDFINSYVDIDFINNNYDNEEIYKEYYGEEDYKEFYFYGVSEWDSEYLDLDRNDFFYDKNYF